MSRLREVLAAIGDGGRLTFAAFHPNMATAGVEANFQHDGTEYRLATLGRAMDDAMTTLLFLGGPPAVGKTTVAPLLAERLAPCAWLEADDVWRITPWEVTAKTRALVESNICHVLREFMIAGYDHVVLTWVLHREDLVQRLLAPLESLAEATHVVYLVADPATLQMRLTEQSARGRSPERALEKLSQIAALSHPKLDTSALGPSEVADAILEIMSATS